MRNKESYDPTAPAHVRPGQRLPAATVNRIIDALGPRTIRTGPMRYRALGGGGLDLSKVIFGIIHIVVNVVTIKAGIIVRGKRPKIDVAGADVTIAADHDYLYCDYNISGGTGSFGVNTAYPTNTIDHYYQVLYQFRLASGVASLEMIHHMGEIRIPSMYA